jgi:hypothetical protein
MSDHSARPTRWRVLVPPALLLAIFSAQIWVHITRTTATSDEPVHILAGYRYWQCGDFAINPEHPPLLKFLATLPLRSRQLLEPDWPCGSRASQKVEVAFAGAQLLARNGMDGILIPTRLAAASLSLLLAVLVYLLATEMFGRMVALVALAILVCEPTLIGHGSLVTTDMALTTTMLLAVSAFYYYGQRRGPARLLASGVAVGVMLAAKHSAIVMLPVLFVLMLADEVLARRGTPDAPRRAGYGVVRVGLAYCAVLLVALGILWGAYGFRYYALPGATHDTLALADLFGADRPEGAQSSSEKLIRLVHRARVFPESYTFGLADIVASGQRPMYLLGAVYPTGRWFYFPVAFTIKSSIAVLLLLPLALLTRTLYRTHPRQMLFLLLPSLAYFGVSLTAGLNIGVRHLLPVYPLFIIVAAAGACWWSRRHRWCLYGLVTLLAFHAVTALRTAPSYLGFANDLWGGTRNTYRLLSDSNADWGQNLKLVEAYVKEHDIHDCWIAAIGMADLVRPNTSCRRLPAYNWAATEQLVGLVPPVIEGTVFISGWELPPWGGREYAALAATEPVDVIGGSIPVFRGRFEVPLATALSYAARADQQLGWQRYAEALQDARTAVELGPNDPRTHWELAFTAARNGLMEEARQQVAAAKRLAHDGPAYFLSKVDG